MVALQIAPAMPRSAGTIINSLGFKPSTFKDFLWEEKQTTRAYRISNLFPRVDKKEYFQNLKKGEKWKKKKIASNRIKGGSE